MHFFYDAYEWSVYSVEEEEEEKNNKNYVELIHNECPQEV